MGAPSASALGVSRASGFVPNSYTSESWSKSDWYNAAQSWNQMLSSTGMSPYGLMEAFEGINKGVDNVMNKNVPSDTKNRGITAKNFGGKKENAVRMQDKTGDYGQKRKPGDYLK